MKRKNSNNNKRCHLWRQERRLTYAIYIDWKTRSIVSEKRYSKKFFTRMGLTYVEDSRALYPQFKFHEKHEPYIRAIIAGAHPMLAVRRYLEDYPLRELEDKGEKVGDEKETRC